MKPPFVIGLPRIEPYSYTEDNEFKGLYAPFHYATNYYLIEKFNVNLIDLGRRTADQCFADASCSGSLYHLQNDTVNFIGDVVLEQFPNLPINLSIGPIMNQEECYLINRPTIEVDVRIQDFISSINRRFDYQVIAVSLLYCLGLSLIVMLTRRLDLKSSNRAITLWSLYEIAFGRRYQPMRTYLSSIGLIFSLFTFFMLLIASCTFQTGLIQSTDFQTIDTLQDVLAYSRIPTVIKYRFCRFSLEKSNIPIFQKIASQLHIIDPEIMDTTEIFEIMNNSSHVLIDDKFYMGLRFKATMCSMKGEEDAMKSPIYTSMRSFDRLKYVFVLSSATDPKITRTAIRLTYSAFETSNLNNHEIREIDFKCSSLNIYGKCTMETFNFDDVISTPLTVRYFNRALIILSVAFLIGFIVFLFELIPSAIKHNIFYWHGVD